MLGYLFIFIFHDSRWIDSQAKLGHWQSYFEKIIVKLSHICCHLSSFIFDANFLSIIIAICHVFVTLFFLPDYSTGKKNIPIRSMCQRLLTKEQSWNILSYIHWRKNHINAINVIKPSQQNTILIFTARHTMGKIPLLRKYSMQRHRHCIVTLDQLHKR